MSVAPLSALASFGVPPLGLSSLLTVLPVLYVAGATLPLVVFDVRHRRLPNMIVLPGLGVVAVSAAAAALWARVDAGATALVAGITLLVFVVFRAAGAIASGDVKLAVLLAAALAPLAGASLALFALAGSSAALTAGLAALLVLARTRRSRRRGVRGVQPDIALGPFLLLGFWVAVTTAIVHPWA